MENAAFFSISTPSGGLPDSAFGPFVSSPFGTFSAPSGALPYQVFGPIVVKVAPENQSHVTVPGGRPLETT